MENPMIVNIMSQWMSIKSQQDKDQFEFDFTDEDGNNFNEEIFFNQYPDFLLD
jgi:hypothetical protein